MSELRHPIQSRAKHAEVAHMLADLIGVSSAYDSTSTCGTHSEYAVPWPCPTARAVQALTETTEETR